MIVEEVFSFPDRYFTKGWRDDKSSEDGEKRVNKDETSSTNTVQDSSPAAVAKSVIPTVIARNKNEIDPVQLNELLLSLVE
jgi:hypothetical protein